MTKNDCPECDAFITEIKAAIAEHAGKQSPSVMSREQFNESVKRYLALPEEAVMRLRESFAMTKLGQIEARFIAASHHHKLR